MNELWQQLRSFKWNTSEPLHSVLCLPGVALPLILGVALGYPGTGVLMAGGAQAVGFGSFQQPLFRRSGPMIAATIGIALSTLVGAVSRDSTALLLSATLIWTVLYGLSNSISSGAGWVGQQCCVFLIVSSAALSTPGTTHDLIYSALLRGAGVFAGGMLQTVLLLALRYQFPQAQTQFSSPDFDPTHLGKTFLREQLRWNSPSLQYALRIATTGVLAVDFYRHFNFPNAYWIGMTAVLIPKPEWASTAARSILRTVGTLLGALVCTAVVTLLHPHGEVLTALVLLFLFLSYLTTNVNYGAFATVLTGYICFLLAIVHQPAHDVLQRRVFATAAGGTLAIVVHLAFVAARSALGITLPRLRTLEEHLGLPARSEHGSSGM